MGLNIVLIVEGLITKELPRAKFALSWSVLMKEHRAMFHSLIEKDHEEIKNIDQEFNLKKVRFRKN